MPRVLLFLVSLLATTLFAADTPDRAVRERVVVKAPVAEVWKAWTTNDGVASFFAPGANIGSPAQGR